MKPQKLKSTISYAAFFSTIHSCKGTVDFITDRGDRLNLKSTLSQLVFTTIIEENDANLTGWIQCSDKQDYELLKNYLKD